MKHDMQFDPGDVLGRAYLALLAVGFVVVLGLSIVLTLLFAEVVRPIVGA